MNTDTIRKWWTTFVGDGGMVEVRVIGERRFSGYFKSLDNLLQCVEPYTKMDNEQVYFTLNEIYPKLYERPQCEKILETKLESKDTTKDPDIIRRKWVLVDFDPVRPTKVSSTADELKAADTKMREVFRFLRDKGFSEPVVACSGNGYHLDFAVDLPNDESTREILRKFFAYLRQEFNDDKVDIDPKNFNASRVCKLYGTMAKKGDNTDERPWRESAIIHIPKEIKPTPIERFEELAKMVKEAPRPTQTVSQYRSGQFSLTEWLTAHGINYREKRNGLSTMYELEWCPWVETHSEKKRWDSALFQDPDGKITFNCHHAHCEGKTWQDVRLFYEPDAYDRQWQQPIPQRQQPRKPKYEIKEELPELGTKWYSLSQIEKVDLDKMEKVKTGYTDLDKMIRGLFMGEVTILTGSNSSGKSSWLNSLMLNIIDQGYKVAMWSGELRPQVLKAWIQMVAAGKAYLAKSQRYDDWYVPDMIGQKIDAWMDGKFYLYNNSYGANVEQIMHDMEILLQAGVKVFILDNLMTLDLDAIEGEKNDKQKGLLNRLHEFVQKYLVHVILVAHPRKVMTFLRKNDISGSSDIQNLADNIFIMHRVNKDFERGIKEYYGESEFGQFEGWGNTIEITKNRIYGSIDSFVKFYYEKESRRFLNGENDIKTYGWLEKSEQSTMELKPQPLQYTPLEEEETRNWWDEPIEPLYTTEEDTPF